MSKFDKKFQWEVSQISNSKFSHAMLLGGLSMNLNHLKWSKFVKIVSGHQNEWFLLAH